MANVKIFAVVEGLILKSNGFINQLHAKPNFKSQGKITTSTGFNGQVWVRIIKDSETNNYVNITLGNKYQSNATKFCNFVLTGGSSQSWVIKKEIFYSDYPISKIRVVSLDVHRYAVDAFLNWPSELRNGIYLSYSNNCGFIFPDTNVFDQVASELPATETLVKEFDLTSL